MKVFISWSGERSKLLAQALREWLPLVLHYVEPWLSEADISAGDRWAQEIAQELEASNFGIICVTPENLGAPWVLFEAGALAKSMQGAKVIPLLFGLEFSDIAGPLAQFQAKKVEKDAVEEVIHSINSSVDQGIPEDRAKQLFAALWGEFEKKLGTIPDKAPTKKHARPQHEILEELVTSVRGLDSRIRELEETAADSGVRSRRMRMRRVHPMMLEELAYMGSESGDDAVGLLALGSMIRDDLPWLYEVILETYRTLRTGDAPAKRQAMKRLQRLVKNLRGGPMMEPFMQSKEGHMLMTELLQILEHFLRRHEERLVQGEDDSPNKFADPGDG